MYFTPIEITWRENRRQFYQLRIRSNHIYISYHDKACLTYQVNVRKTEFV